MHALPGRWPGAARWRTTQKKTQRARSIAPADAPAPPASAAPEKPYGTTGPAVTPPGVTPSMAQFLDMRRPIRTACCFYRMGDFYELFFEDAVAAAQALGIVLTKRGKHLGEDIPMCGVPIHRAPASDPPRLSRRRVRAAGPGGKEARLEGSRAPRRGAPRHARHADRQPARRQGARLSDRRVRRPQGRPRPDRHDRARLPRHLDGSSRWARCRRPTPGEIGAPVSERSDRCPTACSPTSRCGNGSACRRGGDGRARRFF